MANVNMGWYGVVRVPYVPETDLDALRAQSIQILESLRAEKKRWDILEEYLSGMYEGSDARWGIIEEPLSGMWKGNSDEC